MNSQISVANAGIRLCGEASQYALADFDREFPTEEACLEYLWRQRLSEDGVHAECPKCEAVTEFKNYGIAGRRSYTCIACGQHVSPAAGTPFHRSSVPLRSWFRAVYLLSATQGGITAAQLSREIDVTYKTTLRVLARLAPLLEVQVSDSRCAGIVAGGRLGGVRCSRTGRIAHDGNMWCRTHLPITQGVEAEIYEDLASPLCECGCGEQVNPWIGVFRTCVADGFTHYEIADLFDFDRSYVSQVLGNPPRFVKGHSSNVYWKGPAGKRRQKQWAQRQEAERTGRFERCAERERNKARRLLLRAHELDQRARRKAIRRASRASDGRPTVLSLDWIVGQNADGGGISKHEVIADPLADPQREYDAKRLGEIVGDMAPEDVAKMDSHSLQRLQERLREEGLVTIGVQKSERERLRDPEKHSGGGIAKSKSRGGKRRRKEQVALMSGKRPSYKQPKRWSRETIEDAA